MTGKDVLILTLSCSLFIGLVIPLRGALVDDTYIHLVYARNLSDTGELSFNRGDPTYGSTSPLWVVLLAGIHSIGGDLLVWCRVLSWIFAIFSIALLYYLVLKMSGRISAAVAGSFMLASEAWFVRWSAVGMETSFAVFVILAVLVSALSSTRSASRSLLFGALLFVAVLARPEALLLVPLSVLAFLLTPREKKRYGLLWLLVFMPLFIIWLFLIKGHTGTFLPLTAGAKQGRPDLSLALFRRALVPVKIMGTTLVLPWIAILAGFCIGIVRDRSFLSFFLPAERSTPVHRGAARPQQRKSLGIWSGKERIIPPPGGSRAGLLLIIMWIFALPLVYVIFDFQVLSRYLLPIAPVVISLGTVSWLKITGLAWKSAGVRKIAFVLFTVFVILENVLFYSIVVVPPTAGFSKGMQGILVGIGEWLRMNSAERVLVATPDIGAVGYYSERRILDLGGLITPELNTMRQIVDVDTIIEDGLYLRFEPDFLVDRHEEPARFSGRILKGVRFVPVMQGTVPNLGIRKPYPVVYTLYRLETVEHSGG